MGGCSVTSKVLLVVLGIIFWVAAGSLMFVGAWVFDTYKKYDELTTANLTLIPASIIIGIGVLMFIIGLVGCIAAGKESKCLLGVFFSLVLIVLVAEIAAGSMGYAYKDEVENAVQDGLHDAIFSNGTTQQDQINFVQSNLHCCGVHNATDWINSPFWQEHNQTLPVSCCKDNCTEPHIGDKDIYPTGCYDKLRKEFNKNLAYITGVAVAFAVIQILGLICTCILICRSKSRDVPYSTLQGGGGLRV